MIPHRKCTTQIISMHSLRRQCISPQSAPYVPFFAMYNPPLLYSLHLILLSLCRF